VCDLTQDALSANLPAGGVNVITMLFVLSAIPPEAAGAALRNVAAALQPGGVVLFRDYGRHDAAQLRFAPGHRLQDQLYVRQDDTLAHYFDKGACARPR
jgi:methyltransferase-like protein 6